MNILPTFSIPRLSFGKRSSRQWLLEYGQLQTRSPADAVGPWKSRYMLVTFSNIPYHQAMRQAAVQDYFSSFIVIVFILSWFIKPGVYLVEEAETDASEETQPLNRA